MEIQPMELVWRSLNPIQQQDVSEDPQSTMFADIFDSVIDSVKETDAEKNEKMYELATGQLDNPAEVTIAATQAELSVNLLVELRNRALEAYSEIMRMSI